MDEQKNVIFLHLVKNGGSTLRDLLDRFYESDEVYAIDSSNTEKFINLPEEERKKIKLLKGHLKYGMHKYLVGPSTYFTFLRKPINRIVSFYNYMGGLEDHPRYEEIHSPGGSFKKFIEHSKGPNMHNGQIRNISGIDDREDLMLEKALENIHNHFSFVGFLERFDESLILLKEIFNWGYPVYARRNKSKVRLITKEGINREEIELIKELNRGDIKLYEMMLKEFDKMIAEKGAKHISKETDKLQIFNKAYRLCDFARRGTRAIGRRIYNVPGKKSGK